MRERAKRRAQEHLKFDQNLLKRQSRPNHAAIYGMIGVKSFTQRPEGALDRSGQERENPMRTAACTILALGLMATLPLATAAQAQEACTTHVVQEGDTLGSISLAAYGALNYQLLFNANADLLRDGAASLVVGSELVVPCADGRLTATTEIAPLDVAVPAVAATPGGYKPTVRFVSGGDWYPFADEGLTGGGFMIRLVSTAMQRAGNNNPVIIGWVDDWSAHQTTLLPTLAFDISVAWYQPECSSLDTVSESTRDLCLNYIFSDSL